MQQLLTITKALADETRVRALVSLREGELCLCQIIELRGLAPSTVSKHMDVLQHAGLIERRKVGRWVYFRLAGRASSPVIKQCLRWVVQAAVEEPIIRSDSKTLVTLRKKDIETLCACYKSS